MKKERFNAWLQKRNETQVRITIGACAGMAFLGLTAFVIKGGLLYLILSAAYGSAWMAALAVLLLFGGLGAAVWLTAPSQLKDAEHEAHTGFQHQTISVAPTLANCWTYAMGSLESDQSIPMRIIGMLMLVPRLIWTSIYVFKRIDQVKQIDSATCGKVIRMVLKKSESVDVSEVAEKFKGIDLPATMRQLSLIDGIVFLTKESVGISLARRFHDALDEGLTGSSSTANADASPFG